MVVVCYCSIRAKSRKVFLGLVLRMAAVDTQLPAKDVLGGPG